MAFALADLYVQFGAKGDKEVGSAIGMMGNVFGKLATIAKAAVATVAGFVAVGLAGTLQGERLAGSVKHFSETIASLFLPVIETASDIIREFSERLSSSGGAVRFQEAMEKVAEHLGRMSEVIMPALIESFEMFAILVETLVNAFDKLAKSEGRVRETLTSIAEGLMPALRGGNLFGQAWAATGLSSSMNGESGRNRGIARVTPGKSSMEGVADTYKRMQTAIINMGGGTNYPRRQVELTEQQLEEQRALRTLIDGRLGAAVQR